MSLKYYINKVLARNCTPRMIWGYKTPEGKFLKNIRISSSTFIDQRKNLKIEDHVYIGHFNFIEASNNMVIGEGCQITNFITLTTHSSHISLRLYGKDYIKLPDPIGYEKGPVKIGEYCFIGPYSVIMPNTTIGKGSLIGAYSQVKGTFPDYAVIKGNPAHIAGDTREIDRRFLFDHPELQPFYDAWSKKK